MEKSKGFIGEFKEFIANGSVMDLAVGIIIGAAFTAIVKSLVDDILMPLVGLILGGVNFAHLAITVGDANITYGNFIQAIINFLLIAFVVFLIIRTINNLKKKEAVEEEAAIAEEIVLLTEIRDALKENSRA